MLVVVAVPVVTAPSVSAGTAAPLALSVVPLIDRPEPKVTASAGPVPLDEPRPSSLEASSDVVVVDVILNAN